MKAVLVAFGMLVGGSALGTELESVQQATYEHESSQQMEALPSAHDGMMQAMTNMCSNMEAMPMSGNVNADFAMMMIPHHQSALEMASAYLTEGADPVLVKMANKIIKAQKKEIAELQQWLDSHKQSQSAGLVN